MSEINNGGSAFPAGLIDPSNPQNAVHPMCPGMTLRDYFAAKAMQVLIADKLARQKDIDDEVRPPDPYIADGEEIAEVAYWYANSMLEAREA